MKASGRRSQRSISSSRRGAMIVFVAVAMVGLMAMMALAIDAGAGNRQRRIAQTAADAAAIGGGTQIFRNLDSAAIVNAALNSALRNGYSPSEVTVNYKIKSGPYANNPDFVEVVIAKNVPTFFGGILGKSSVDIQARAIAGTAAWSSLCVYGLSNSGTAINIPGDLDATTCGVSSNSSIDVGKLWGNPISAVGTVDGDRGGAVYTGVAPAPDPYSDLGLPADLTCTVGSRITLTQDSTFNPGVYCGGIAIGANHRATLSPGTYVILGGGIDGSQNNAELHGTNVTIINANGPSNDASLYRPIKFGNSCSVNLSAPTSGAYKGIVIYADRNAPSSGPYSMNEFCGVGGDPDIRGVIYMPTQEFKLTNANGKLVIAGTLIARTITGQNGGGKYELRSDETGNSGVKRLSLVQ